jgi:hypothetical protein
MTIEALVVDNAEKRATLKPEPIPKNVPKLLARADGDYDSIAGKNVFFGPAPPSRERGPQEKEVELADFLHLTDVTAGEGWCQAGIFDRLARRMYVIRCEGGKFVCERFDYQGGRDGGRWKSWSKSPVLVLLGEDASVYRKYEVVKIGYGEIFLRPLDEKELVKRAVMAAFAGAGQPVRALNEIDALMRTPERTVRWTMDKPLSGAEPLNGEAPAAATKVAAVEPADDGNQ